MYDGATAQRKALNFKPLSPPNLRDLFSPQILYRRPYVRHKF